MAEVENGSGHVRNLTTLRRQSKVAADADDSTARADEGMAKEITVVRGQAVLCANLSVGLSCKVPTVLREARTLRPHAISWSGTPLISCSAGGSTMTNERRTSKAAILAQIPAARAREARARRTGRRAISARYDRPTGRVMIELTMGYVFGFPTDAIPALAKARPEQLAAVEVSPGGSGLHWEALDIDLSVPGLLLSSLGRAQQRSELARLAGRTTSRLKAAAARANGAKGGRPRKSARRG